jgi:hypothetical protein
MSQLTNNRTLQILNAATVGNYGVLAAIACEGPESFPLNHQT